MTPSPSNDCCVTKKLVTIFRQCHVKKVITSSIDVICQVLSPAQVSRAESWKVLILKVIIFPLQKRGQQIASGTQGVGIYEWADAPLLNLGVSNYELKYEEILDLTN